MGPAQGEAAPSRRRTSGRSRPWRALPLRTIAAAALMMTVAGGVWWGIDRFVLDHPYFFVKAVELRGAKFAAQSQVEDQFIADRGRSLLRLPLEERRLAIEQIPWVKSAAVTRLLPNRIAVAIEERTPVAFLWTADGLSLIDAEGVILDLPRDSSFAFPVVRGVSQEQSSDERRVRMELFMALLSDLERGEGNLIAGISEVDLGDPEDARVVVADGFGAVLLHLGNEDFLPRYLLYASQITHWQQKFASVRSVDLRFEGQVVINADAQLPAGEGLPRE